MSSETHEIRLIAKDGASSVFRMAGTNAERMNQQIERSNQRTKRSWEDIGRTAQRAGAAIGAFSLVSINAANKAEVSQTRLKQSVENTGKAYEDYADAIAKAQKAAIKLAFDDEDAADSISKLTQATNDAGKAIQDLSLAEDIARARGISLESATNLVVAAEQGRIGALKRVGIALDDNATSEDALAALRTKYAGQAQAYAQTNAATWDRARISAENALEAIGAKLATHQTEILAVSAAWTAFGGSIGSVARLLGAGGMGALLSGAGIAGILGLSGYAAMTSGTPGNNTAASLFNMIFGGVAGGINAVLPGNPLNTQKYSNAMTANSIEEAVKGLFYNPQGYGNDAMIYQALIAAGLAQPGLPLKMKNGKVTGMDMSADEWNALLAGINQQATSVGMTPGQYYAASASNRGLVQDPVSGMWGYPEQIAAMKSSRDALIGAPPATTGTPTRLAGRPGTAAAPTQRPGYGISADGETRGGGGENLIAAGTAALKAQYGAYATLADGVITATDALGAFKTAQDGIIASEGKYSGQLTEYNTQLSNLDAAYEVLQKRQAEGQQLSKSDIEFLDGYTAAHERLAGGVDDATVALGKQAEKYADNMTAADEFKGATGDMTSAVRDLITALEGIPGYVKAVVDTQVNDGGAYNLGSYLTWLNGQEFRTRYVNETVNITTGQVAGPSVDAMQHGGLVRAQHGYAGGSRSVMVGEAGPEILTLPGGSHITPAAASKFSNKRKSGGGDGLSFHNVSITVVANSPKQFGDAMRGYALAGSRN